MVLNTSASISFSQLNSTVFFTNGNLGVNTTSPTVNLDVNGTMNVSGTSSLVDVTATNITASNLISTTSVSSGILSATNVIGTNITTDTLSASTISASNLSLSGNVNIGGTLTTVNITSTNLKNTNISSGTLNVSGLSILANTTATNISTGGLIVDNIIASSINGSTLDGSSLTCTNISVANTSTDTITTASILASGLSNLSSVPTSSINISTGSLNVSGTTILANTTATNVSVGTIIASTGITTGTIRAIGTSSLSNTTVTNISTGGVNASGTSVLANTTVTNFSTGGLNASGTSVLSNTTATNVSVGVLIASTGITTGSIRTSHLNIASTTIPFINTNNTNTSNINITTSNLRLTQVGCPINHYTSVTSSGVYMSFQQNSGAVTGIIGLDGVGYSGVQTGSFAISTWTAHPINFLTNNVNRMTINSSGNIGIGTTSPSYPLEVNGGIKTTSMTVANINLSGGNLVLRNTGHTSGLSFGDHNSTGAYSKIYDDGHMNIWTDDNMHFDIGATFASASTKLFMNSTGVGINTTTSPAYNLSINTTTDTPGMNPDACNSLLVYEDMQGTTVRSGTLAGANVSYLQNNYVQLTPGNGAPEFGQWYWNINPGNAFSTDYEVQVTSTADGHIFFWGSDTAPSTTQFNGPLPVGYCVFFDEYNGNGTIKLYYNNSLLTSVIPGTLRNSNWVKIRIVYQRNTIKVYYNGSLQINYKDTARHSNYSNSYMGFTAVCGGQTSAHRVRELRIQKLMEGVWTHVSQTSGNIMFPAGNVGINTSNPAYTLDVNGTIAQSGFRLPIFNNGTFSGGSTAVIPILFSDTNYNYVDIKLKFRLSNNGGTNVTLTGNTANAGNGSTLSLAEVAETTTRWGNVTAYTNSGLVATTCEGNNNDNLFTIRIIRSSGTSSHGLRNHYQFDTSYIWSGVGATRVYGMGWFENASVGGAALGSIILTCATGTMSGTYSTQHSY